jgi:hypothetical protein
MSKTCGECRFHHQDYHYCQADKECKSIYPESPACENFAVRTTTVGDKIRSMSDEKLLKVIWKGLCGLCPYKGSGNICNNNTDKECHEIILEELKKEVNHE